jgi:hypothetical protein
MSPYDAAAKSDEQIPLQLTLHLFAVRRYIIECFDPASSRNLYSTFSTGKKAAA